MHALVKVAYSASALFAILIFQNSYEESLFEKSLTYIPEIQADSSSGLQTFWDIFSNGGLTLMTVLPIGVPYVQIAKRSSAFYYLSILILIQMLTTISKLYYH